MKKFFLFLAAAAMITVVGCQKPEDKADDQDKTEQSSTTDPNTPSGTDDPTVSTEDYLQETAIALMDAFALDNWKADAEYVHKVVKSIKDKNYNYDAFEDWADALNDIWEQDPVTEGTTTYYKTIVKLSDAKGHFVEQADGSFQYTEAQDLQVTIDVDGEKVTATFTCTDSQVLVPVGGSKYGHIDDDGINYIETAHNNYVYVPESATLKILRGNTEFASLVLNTSATIQNPDQPNYLTDSASLNVTLNLSGYTVSVNKLSYSPTLAQVDVKILQGNASLVTVTADAEYVLDNTLEIPVKSGKLNATIDIMGRVQLKGNLPDFAAFSTAGTEMSNAMREGNEDVFKAKVAALEQTFSVKLYFNGADAERASFGLEPIHRNNGYGSEYWSCAPVIRFPDGSSYGIDEYFTDGKFNSVLNHGEELWDAIEHFVSDLFGDI